MFHQHEDSQPLHRQQEPPSSPSSAKHLISAPLHASALHHLVDMPLSLPDLAPYSEQHGLQAGHLLPETFSALTAPLFGGAPSDLFLPSSATPASRLPTEDHLFSGLLPTAFSLNPTNAQLGKTSPGPGQQQTGEQPLGTRLPEASPDSNQDGPSHKAPVRNSKRHRDAWEGLLPGQAHADQQQRGEHQHSVANSPSKPPRRPPLRSANVTARAPQDADSGTDTDGDDDVLQRVRCLQSARLIVAAPLVLPTDVIVV